MLRGKLASWKGRFLFIAGRVTLINSVTNNFAMHLISFFKARVKVIKEIKRIQRNFLWHRSATGKGICWVKWSKVCKSKVDGGISIKDVSAFNKALMSKRIWRFLKEDESIWKALMEHRYGNLKQWFWSNDLKNRRSKSSLWWRDLVNNNGKEIAYGFLKHVYFKLGSSMNIPFGSAKWIG